ncbi:MAG: response regulator [Lachnospiraceae bacterium]
MVPILICDDELTLRKGLGKLIERSGLPVSICGLASNGLEAFDLIRQTKPSIVLMDINMPGMSGLEVISKVRELEIPVEFIIISGHDEFQYAQQACRLAVTDYLLKPICKEDLIALLERLISKLPKEPPATSPGGADPAQAPLADRLLHYVRLHFSENTLSLMQVADEFHVSQSYVTRLIKQASGKSFTELLNQYRIEYAIQLLSENSERKLWAIADACGFTSQHYFSRVFKQITGSSPADYRKRI